LNGSVRVKLHNSNQSHFTVAKKTLCQLRQLYFKLKDEVFSNDRIGFAYNTEALEKLLKEELGMDMTMNDVKFPRYIESIPTYSLTLSHLSISSLLFPPSCHTQVISHSLVLPGLLA